MPAPMTLEGRRRMCGGGLIATNEPAVVAKPLLDPMVVKDSEENGHLSNFASTDEVLSSVDYLLD